MTTYKDTRINLLKIFSGVGLFALLILGSVNLFYGSVLIGYVQLGAVIIGVTNLVFLLITDNYTLASYIFLAVMFVLFHFVLYIGGISNSAPVWLFLFLISSHYLLTKIKGILVNGLFVFSIIVLYVLQYLGLLYSSQELVMLRQLILSLIVGSIFLGSLIVTSSNSLEETFIKNTELDELKLKLKKEIEEREAEDDANKKRNASFRSALLNLLDDIKEEKNAAEKALQEATKFKLAVEYANDQVTITDPDGIILYANMATEKITGFKIGEMIGKKAGTKDLWGGLMPKIKYEDFWKTIKTEKKDYVGEFENHKKSGEHYYSEIHVSPILNSSGKVVYFVAIERDITKIIELDRMKTDFISLASHQLRTPLSAMKWILEILGGGDLGTLNDKQKEAIENVNLSNERMIGLVNSLLNISRIESGKIVVEPEDVKVDEFVISTIKSLDNRFKLKNQKITTTCQEALPTVNFDPKLIREVLVNLLTNAIKYTPEGGKIEVMVTTEKNNLLVGIADNGYGVPENEKVRIFERFYRASNIIKRETDGTGLGLYLCKTVVESSGGKIWFESTIDKGSTFWFTLPLSSAKSNTEVVS